MERVPNPYQLVQAEQQAKNLSHTERDLRVLKVEHAGRILMSLNNPAMKLARLRAFPRGLVSTLTDTESTQSEKNLISLGVINEQHVYLSDQGGIVACELDANDLPIWNRRHAPDPDTVIVAGDLALAAIRTAYDTFISRANKTPEDNS